MLQRIGHGYDVHAFDSESRSGEQSIVLGGVTIPYHKSLKAHSDGDVVLHALCDALLGAAALGDIGRHFPDTDSAYEDADSRQLLAKVMRMLEGKQFKVNNVDITIVAQAPKLAAYIAVMCGIISKDLNITEVDVNVKATTTERLGYIGREEGIAVHAVVMICGIGD